MSRKIKLKNEKTISLTFLYLKRRTIIQMKLKK